ncbi:ornithine cyclodeaminase [Paraburkholderia caffeinilytica]|uniref:Ornithine cyclodeaminase n=1 Tax=Paraburkholderia caffeinilytica TaxID=1761016 RepID=A0ABQ1N9Q4_9BURK|nr:bifunctional Delta(1)-pyrroline-2-carboxylate/Delta(1)-piperideine-2-carboxylate reductase [Paraburkholderia caffeinilytica]AXL49751.1 ornithine cyclodeaminase [Paraburkholderia caffeinilytica]GGC60953.1 ornithine cyclodeaminase [Paraburkholderia caffeinilytica]CAB3795200.1 Delta(1)-pyrroline-2-carboxylate reductase 1 [Paraburkholderia caffeinilytica]
MTQPTTPTHPTNPTAQIFDAAATARLIPYATLVDALKRASIDYAQQRIASPERLVVPLNEGGIMLSMPATAPDLAIHKLVNVCASNRPRGIPTIHGQVMAFDADTGETLFILDGPTVTGRRTAAMSMLGVRTFAPARPREFLLIGTGTQAVNHLEAIGELYPDARVWVKGSAPARAEAFCAAHGAHGTHGTRGAHGGNAREPQPLANPDAAIPDSIDVVVALTTSKEAVYDEAARADRLVIGVGAFTPAMVEIGARTIAGSALFVDDQAGARHEAGDFIQAGVDWARVGGIADVVANAALSPSKQAIVFKSVGCAAWDLAACRVAREALSGG